MKIIKIKTDNVDGINKAIALLNSGWTIKNLYPYSMELKQKKK